MPQYHLFLKINNLRLLIIICTFKSDKITLLKINEGVKEEAGCFSEVSKLQAHEEGNTGLHYDQMGKKLYVGSEEGRLSVFLYDSTLQTFSLQMTTHPHEDRITGIKYMESINMLVTCSYDRQVKTHFDPQSHN